MVERTPITATIGHGTDNGERTGGNHDASGKGVISALDPPPIHRLDGGVWYCASENLRCLNGPRGFHRRWSRQKRSLHGFPLRWWDRRSVFSPLAAHPTAFGGSIPLSQNDTRAPRGPAVSRAPRPLQPYLDPTSRSTWSTTQTSRTQSPTRYRNVGPTHSARYCTTCQVEPAHSGHSAAPKGESRPRQCCDHRPETEERAGTQMRSRHVCAVDAKSEPASHALKSQYPHLPRH
jgi:hypothetical protein